MTQPTWVRPTPQTARYCAAMAQDEWSARLAQTVGQQIRKHRDEQKMSAQKLADACVAAGLPLERAVIANLENGRRGNVTVAELMVLANVLGVAPIELVFPVGRVQAAEPLPGRSVDAWWAAQWFTGERQLDGAVVDTSPVALFRRHTERLDRWHDHATKARTIRAIAIEDEAEQRERVARAEEHEARARMELHHLRTVRQEMRRRGLTPPDLPLNEVGALLALQLSEVDDPGGVR